MVHVCDLAQNRVEAGKRRRARHVRACVRSAKHRFKGVSTAPLVDVSREDDIARFFATVGPFDHLVFTAGEALTLNPLSTMGLDTAREAFTRRYWGALSAVKYGREGIRPGGSIVLTTGAAKDRPHPGWTVAASICGAIDALTRALAVELAPIRVNAVSPGVVRTRCGTTWRRATVRRSIARSAARYR